MTVECNQLLGMWVLHKQCCMRVAVAYRAVADTVRVAVVIVVVVVVKVDIVVVVLNTPGVGVGVALDIGAVTVDQSNMSDEPWPTVVRLQV